MEQDNAARLPANAAAPIPHQPAPPAPPAPGAVAAEQNAPAPARTNRAPRRQGLVNSAATISGLPPLYLLAANQPFATVPRNSLNTYIPSFIHAAAIISEMDYIMSYTHRFLQGAPSWLPSMSLLYFGILFMIQTLRAMRETGNLFGDLLWLLEGFETIFDLRSLMVAGPLVPIFQSLAACSGPHTWLGDITPALPDAQTLNASQASAYAANSTTGIYRLLPDIPFYMDCLQKIATATTDFTADSVRLIHSSIMNVNASSTASIRTHLYGPGSANPLTYTLQQINTARNNLGFLSFPPALDASATSTTRISIAQFMRFYDTDGNYHTWFAQVSSVMQRYCQFQNHSVPLSAISPTSNAAGSVIWKFSPGNTNLTTPYTFVAATTAPAVAAHYKTNCPTSLKVTGSHADELLEEVAEQCSSVSSVNCSFAGSGITAPTDATVRSGPYWTIDPIRQSQAIDIVPSLASNITTHYHNDTRARAPGS